MLNTLFFIFKKFKTPALTGPNIATKAFEIIITVENSCYPKNQLIKLNIFLSVCAKQIGYIKSV